VLFPASGAVATVLFCCPIITNGANALDGRCSTKLPSGDPPTLAIPAKGPSLFVFLRGRLCGDEEKSTGKMRRMRREVDFLVFSLANTSIKYVYIWLASEREINALLKV
jgi:hypothetical protein